MSKIAVVYWSGTGNTEIMAQEVAAGAKAAGAEADVLTPSDFDSSKISAYDAIAFGCPAMVREVLEEAGIRADVERVRGSLSGVKIAVRFLRMGRRRMDAHLGRAQGMPVRFWPATA